jgi:hypothetical protein
VKIPLGHRGHNKIQISITWMIMRLVIVMAKVCAASISLKFLPWHYMQTLLKTRI